MFDQGIGQHDALVGLHGQLLSELVYVRVIARLGGPDPVCAPNFLVVEQSTLRPLQLA